MEVLYVSWSPSNTPKDLKNDPSLRHREVHLWFKHMYPLNNMWVSFLCRRYNVIMAIIPSQCWLLTSQKCATMIKIVLCDNTINQCAIIMLSCDITMLLCDMMNQYAITMLFCGMTMFLCANAMVHYDITGPYYAITMLISVIIIVLCDITMVHCIILMPNCGIITIQCDIVMIHCTITKLYIMPSQCNIVIITLLHCVTTMQYSVITFFMTS